MEEKNNKTFFLFNDAGDSFEDVLSLVFSEYFSKKHLKQDNYNDNIQSVDDCLGMGVDG